MAKVVIIDLNLVSMWGVVVEFEDKDVMPGGDICWCVVLGTLVGASVFSVMWLELLMMLEINVPLHVIISV